MKLMLHIYSYLATTFKSLAAEINKIYYLLGNLAEPYIIALVEKSFKELHFTFLLGEHFIFQSM